ncbi:MAG TPA: hypothetical protein VK174_07390, partial [Chitinophagales bacterium]|nr:hypothetical protein [Chitinophagales bacterium]
MKLKISLLSCFVLLMFSVVFAQTTPDTIPYRITQYELKKTQKVSAVAKSLKVDPATIVKLNKLKSTEQELPKGRRLKVPQYGKGVVYIPPSERKPEKEVVKKESAPKAKSKEKSKPETVIIIEDKPRVPVEKSTTTKPEKQKAPAKKEEDKQPKEKKAAEKKPAD